MSSCPLPSDRAPYAGRSQPSSPWRCLLATTVIAVFAQTGGTGGPVFAPATSIAYAEARLDLPGGQHDALAELVASSARLRGPRARSMPRWTAARPGRQPGIVGGGRELDAGNIQPWSNGQFVDRPARAPGISASLDLERAAIPGHRSRCQGPRSPRVAAVVVPDHATHLHRGLRRRHRHHGRHQRELRGHGPVSARGSRSPRTSKASLDVLAGTNPASPRRHLHGRRGSASRRPPRGLLRRRGGPAAPHRVPAHGTARCGADAPGTDPAAGVTRAMRRRHRTTSRCRSTSSGPRRSPCRRSARRTSPPISRPERCCTSRRVTSGRPSTRCSRRSWRRSPRRTGSDLDQIERLLGMPLEELLDPVAGRRPRHHVRGWCRAGRHRRHHLGPGCRAGTRRIRPHAHTVAPGPGCSHHGGQEGGPGRARDHGHVHRRGGHPGARAADPAGVQHRPRERSAVRGPGRFRR